MNKLDTVYFQAVMTADEEGTVAVDALRLLSDNARKFVIINEPAEAVRFYERIFQLWRTIAQHQPGSLPVQTAELFTVTLSEYVVLLYKLGRRERAQLVQEATGIVID